MIKNRVFLGSIILFAFLGNGLRGEVWSEVKNDTAVVHHDDAEFNCCPYMIFTTEYNMDTIDIYEQDTLPSCWCVCNYDFAHTFEGLEPGTYLARVWESTSPSEKFNLAGTTSFTIPVKVSAFSTKTWMSECHEAVGERPPKRGIEFKEALSPTGDHAQIRYWLPSRSDVKLQIFDVTGIRIRTLEAGVQEPGEHILTWNITNDRGEVVPRGLYFVRLEASGQARSLPLIVLR